jgi:hypothetical protein
MVQAQLLEDADAGRMQPLSRQPSGGLRVAVEQQYTGAASRKGQGRHTSRWTGPDYDDV